MEIPAGAACRKTHCRRSSGWYPGFGPPKVALSRGSPTYWNWTPIIKFFPLVFKSSCLPLAPGPKVPIRVEISPSDSGALFISLVSPTLRFLRLLHFGCFHRGAPPTSFTAHPMRNCGGARVHPGAQASFIESSNPLLAGGYEWFSAAPLGTPSVDHILRPVRCSQWISPALLERHI